MHAHHPFRLRHPGGNTGERYGRGVGCQNGIRPHHAAQFAEDAFLDGRVFGGGFDDQIPVGQFGQQGGGVDARQNGRDVGVSQAAFLGHARQAVANGGQALVQGGLSDVGQFHVKAMHGKNLGNAVAHGAGTDDGDVEDAHLCFSCVVFITIT